jgi:hypothetical protein
VGFSQHFGGSLQIWQVLTVLSLLVDNAVNDYGKQHRCNTSGFMIVH